MVGKCSLSISVWVRSLFLFFLCCDSNAFHEEHSMSRSWCCTMLGVFDECQTLSYHARTIEYLRMRIQWPDLHWFSEQKSSLLFMNASDSADYMLFIFYPRICRGVSITPVQSSLCHMFLCVIYVRMSDMSDLGPLSGSSHHPHTVSSYNPA